MFISKKKYQEKLDLIESYRDRKNEIIKENSALKAEDFVLKAENLVLKEIYESIIEYMKKELEKKDKVINEMAEWMARGNKYIYATVEDVKEDFYNKVEREVSNMTYEEMTKLSKEDLEKIQNQLVNIINKDLEKMKELTIFPQGKVEQERRYERMKTYKRMGINERHI